MKKPSVMDISSAKLWAVFKDECKVRQATGKKLLVKFVEADRTTDQNSMSFALYKQISAQCPDQSINEIRAECKLNIGVGLLREADAEFNRFYQMALLDKTYEQKLFAMKFTPVTSRMKKPVFIKYLNEVLQVYSQQGYSLIDPLEAKSYEQ